jgi:hypothetical protein
MIPHIQPRDAFRVDMHAACRWQRDAAVYAAIARVSKITHAQRRAAIMYQLARCAHEALTETRAANAVRA